ncbi:hypothetical protein THRCLA_01357, partial [Thraustotheca clavata]
REPDRRGSIARASNDQQPDRRGSIARASNDQRIDRRGSITQASENRPSSRRLSQAENSPSSRRLSQAENSPILNRPSSRRLSQVENSQSNLNRSSSRRDSNAPKLTLSPAPNEATSNVYRGWLYKEGQNIRNWKRRYFVLSNDHIAYYAKQGENAKGEGRVLEVAVNTQKTCSLLLRLDSERILRIAADSQEEIDRWYAALRGCLKTQQHLDKKIKSSIRYSGYLFKKGQNVKSWRRRYFVLMGFNQLGYSDKEGDAPKGYDKAVDVCVNAKKPFCIYIHMESGRRMSVAAESQAEIDKWYSILSQVAAAVAQSESRPQSQDNDEERSIHTNHKGWLQKEGKTLKTWKRRYFTLHGRLLVYRKAITTDPIGQGFVTSYTEGVGRAFAIDIHFETGRVLRVAANSERDRNQWMAALSTSMKSKVDLVKPTDAVSLRSNAITLQPPNQEPANVEGWMEWENARTYFVLENAELGFYANKGGLRLGRGTFKDMRVENFRDFIMTIVFQDAKPIRVKAESGGDLNMWRNAFTALLQAAKKPVVRGAKGYLMKEGKNVKSWKRRYFLLKGRNISYFKSEAMDNELGGGLLVHVKANPSKELSLILILENGRLLVVAAHSDNEFVLWFKAFKLALTDSPPTNAPEEVPEKQNMDDGDDEDEYQCDDDDDIYKTNCSYASFAPESDDDIFNTNGSSLNDDDDDDIYKTNSTDIYKTNASGFEDFDHDDEDADSSDEEVQVKEKHYDSDGLSSLSSLSDFED